MFKNRNLNQDTNKIRLVYVKIEEGFDTIAPVVGLITALKAFWAKSEVLELPKGMNMEDACKVVSFILQRVQGDNTLSTYFNNARDKLLSYGFKVVEGEDSDYSLGSSTQSEIKLDKIEGVTDLFLVGKGRRYLKRFELGDRYFKWFYKGVTADDIYNIYSKLGFEIQVKPIENTL